MKTSNAKQWLKVIEFVVISLATWLNPEAGFLIFLLKLCFQILAALQEGKAKKNQQSQEEKAQRS